MIDHVGIQVADVQASLSVYLTAFAATGMHEIMRFPSGDQFVVGLGAADDHADFWLGPPTVAGETRELHIAFRAPDRAAIHAVHAAAVAAGMEVLHAPKEWPEYHPGYYAVFLRDLDGHNIEAVCHSV